MAARKACAVATGVNYNGRPAIVAAAVQRIAGAFDESARGPFDGAHQSFMLASELAHLLASLAEISAHTRLRFSMLCRRQRCRTR